MAAILDGGWRCLKSETAKDNSVQVSEQLILMRFFFSQNMHNQNKLAERKMFTEKVWNIFQTTHGHVSAVNILAHFA